MQLPEPAGSLASSESPTASAGAPVPIGQLTESPEWPQNALGVFVSIHGFEGVVVDIIGQSLKVQSSERITQRFNANRLRTLFAPPDRSRPVPSTTQPPPPAPEPASAAEATAEPAEPVRQYVEDPDFSQPMKAIRTFAAETDFPQCAYGRHVDISGFSGVVVEIVRGSLKVRAADGTLRSYNAVTLRKLYGR